MPRKKVFEELAREWDYDAEQGTVGDEREKPALDPERAATGLPSTSVVAHDAHVDEDAQPFEYTLLSPMGRLEVMASEARIIEIEQRSVVAVGRELRTIRDRIRQEVGWGYWYGWLAMTRRARTTAAGKIRAADWADRSKSAIVAGLPAAVAYRAANADDNVRHQVLKLAAAGKKLTVEDVKRLIDGRKSPDVDRTTADGTQDEATETSPFIVEGPRDTAEGMPNDSRGGMTAAYQLVGKLRERFTKREIADLFDLWQQTNAVDLLKVWAETRPTTVRRIAAAAPISHARQVPAPAEAPATAEDRRVRGARRSRLAR